MDNNELISAIRDSSERAFQIVFNKYYQGLVRFACSYTENSDAAENIVQDSFVVLWEKREILEEDSNLHALLVQIVKLGNYTLFTLIYKNNILYIWILCK